MFKIPRISSLSQFQDRYLLLALSERPWSAYASAPEVFAHLAYVDGYGLAIRLVSDETELKATVNVPDGTVCTDSCMEAFLDLVPESGKGYVNLEVNPLAALHEAIGTSRNGRRFTRELGAPPIKPLTLISPDGWEVMYVITEEHIDALYGTHPKSGDVIKANFYCCADGKKEPFYATAFKIDTPTPDYHRPEYFGELTLE